MPSPILSLDDMVALYKKSVYFTVPAQYEMALIASVAVRIQSILEDLEFCAYLLYWGNPDSGKSKATRFLCKISRGKFSKKTTEAGLLRSMDEVSSAGGMLGLDQYDDQVLAHPLLDGCMEIGNEPDALYTVSEKVGQKIVVKDIRVGGYKVFNAIAPPRHALRTRTYEVHMVKAPKQISKAIASRTNVQDIQRLSATLDGLAASILATYGKTDVATFLQSQRHQDDLDKLDGGRKYDLFNVFDTVREFLGWGTDVVGALSYSNADENLLVAHSVLTMVIQDNGLAGTEVRPDVLLGFVNKRYSAMMCPTLKNAWELNSWMCALGIDDRFRERRKDTMYYCFPIDIIDASAKQTRLKWGTAHLSGGTP